MADAIYVVYGSNGAADVNLTDRFTEAGGVWSSQSAAPSPSRDQLNACSHGDGSIGALQGDGGGTAYADLDQLTLSGHTWTSLTSAGATRRRSSYQQIPGTGYTAQVCGQNSSSVSQNEYNPYLVAGDTWHSGTAPGTAGYGLVVAGAPGGDDKIYVYFGNGWTTTNRRFDHSGSTWSARATTLTGSTSGLNQGWTSGAYVHTASDSQNQRHSAAANTWSSRAALTNRTEAAVAGNESGAYGYITGGDAGVITHTKIVDSTNIYHAKSALSANRTSAAGSESALEQITYFIQVQYDNSGVWTNVASQSGDAGTGVQGGLGKTAYWDSPVTDLGAVESTETIRIEATIE